VTSTPEANPTGDRTGAAAPRFGLTVLGILRAAVQDCPDQEFLNFSGQAYTFADVDLRVTRFAHELIALGLQPGQTAGSILETSIDSIVTWMAVNLAGGIWVPLNTAYRGEFLRHQLADSQARLLICDADYLQNVVDVAPELPDLRLILVGGMPVDLTPCSVPVVHLEHHRGHDGRAFSHSPAPSDLSLLVYTSGTTGPSKGCMLSHNYICNQGLQCNQAVPPMPGEGMYTCLPLFHVSALSVVIAAMAVRCPLAISPRFSVSGFWAEIERSGARNATLMGSIFPLLASAPDSPTMQRCRGQLRAVTGVPVAPEVRAIWKERFGVEHINTFGYGLTEGARLALHRYEAGKPLPPESSCGEIASDDFHVVVLDDADNVLPDGAVGEIAFRPRRPNVMFDGYWRRPEDTALAWRNLWMHTGDLGRIEEGRLFFVDRKKDYLRNRGENISSFEIETAFLRHPDLVEVAVHEVGEGVGEDRMKLTAVLTEGSKLTEEQLCRWALDKVPYFAIPRYIEFRDDLPRTATSKIMKFQLRNEGCPSGTWDREEAGITVRRPRPGSTSAR
jgi:crotonobetaine/carnitine-CoA ligase